MFRLALRPNHASAASAASATSTSADFVDLRLWQPRDRQVAATLIGDVLAEYGLGWEPQGADRDAIEVEAHYGSGEFWVLERAGEVVGTGAFYAIDRAEDADRAAAEIRKMYLRADVRGRGLGRKLLHWLETRAYDRGFRVAWIETASVLAEAVRLYETAGYAPATGVETARCDRVYRKPLVAAPSTTAPSTTASP